MHATVINPSGTEQQRHFHILVARAETYDVMISPERTGAIKPHTLRRSWLFKNRTGRVLSGQPAERGSPGSSETCSYHSPNFGC